MNSEGLAWKLRRHVLEMTHVAESSHIGSNYSIADIIAVLYNDIMNINPQTWTTDEHDRFVLSKGHASAIIYAVLAEKGFIDLKQLLNHCSDDSSFSAMVSNFGNPGVEFATGSLGHGFPVAVGMAYASKINEWNNKVYVICGDGECDEGSIWESALIAQQQKLDNLVAIIDFNKIQCLNYCENVTNLNPFADKWKAFGWNVEEIDGHDHAEIRASLIKAKENNNGKPTAIIAHTIKGKGVSFMENNIVWHYRFPHSGGEYETALEELNSLKPQEVIDPYQTITV